MEIKPAFIGLGVMGAPMAKRVLAKFGSLVVFDVEETRVSILVGEGAKPVSSPADCGKNANVAVLSLPSSPIVRQVSEELSETLQPGGVIIDTSTTEPTVSIEIGRKLSEKDIRFLDAPVSGGEKAAIEGSLSIMVGGSKETFDECLPLLEAMGSSVVRVGEIGAGETAKMVNQMIVGATFAIIAESFALGVKAGLNPAELYQAIQGGWAGSKVLDVAAPAMLERNFKPGGTVNIHWKDLGYALSLAKDIDVPTPLTALVHEIFKASKAAGDGSLSQPAVVRLWEKLLGIEVSGGQ